MKTFFAILLLSFTGFAFADGHLKVEEGHHAETEAGSDDHSAHGMEVAPMAPPVESEGELGQEPGAMAEEEESGWLDWLFGGSDAESSDEGEAEKPGAMAEEEGYEGEEQPE